jgi:hypothetical protein
MKRRQLIKGLLAASVASLGGVAAFQYYQQGQLEISRLVDSEFLTLDDQMLLAVLIPVFATSMATPPKINKTIDNIDQAITRLPLRTQGELRELFDMLNGGFGRMLLAGVWLNWQRASADSIEEFLVNWREHRLDLLQQAYLGLHQLIMGAIYAESEIWSQINYPGPPKLY